MSYSGKFFIREEEVDGVANWMWPIADTLSTDGGAWKGPVEGWKEWSSILLSHVKDKRVVVQAGGNCGLYPRLLSEHFDAVYTFEPNDENFFCLVNNCQSPNIIKINAAVGAFNALIELEHEGTNVGTYITTSTGKSFIPQFTIDQLTLRHCDLIMLDVEGYELQALKGAKKTIETFHPVICCEYFHYIDHSPEMNDFLAPLGYICKGLLGKQDILFVYQEDRK